MFSYLILVQNELEILLDSLLQLQQSLILRHRDTHHLIDSRDNANPPVTQDDSSDEDIPSDSEIDEEEKDEKRGGKWQKRKRSKRKCPWVRFPQHQSSCPTLSTIRKRMVIMKTIYILYMIILPTTETRQ